MQRYMPVDPLKLVSEWGNWASRLPVFTTLPPADRDLYSQEMNWFFHTLMPQRTTLKRGEMHSKTMVSTVCVPGVLGTTHNHYCYLLIGLP